MRALHGKRVAILATDMVEQVELVVPRRALENAGAETELVSLWAGEIQAFKGYDKADTFRVDRTVRGVDVDDYDALFLPGGVGNPDSLRTDAQAVGLVRAFSDARKPIGAICHGPWLLVEADVIRGWTLTSYPSIKTDIRNAGGIWVDEEAVADSRLITAQKPAALPLFCPLLVEAVSSAGRVRRAEAAWAWAGGS